MSNPSTLTADFPCDSTPSTAAADDVGKEQDDVPKSTIEQDTPAVDDSLLGSLNPEVASEHHLTSTSDVSLPTSNVVPGADLSTHDADDNEVWIPKGNPDRPNGTQTKPPGPARPPSKPKRDD